MMETAATSKTNSPWDARWDSCWDTWDLSQDCEAWDATLAQTITEAVAREMAKAHAHYQAILNERSAATLQTSLNVSSGANGFKVLDPFDWTKDKSIYQRWQLWSEKARLTLDAMEGDSEKTQDFLLPSLDQWRGNGTHWVMENSKTLISQSAYDELESTEGKYSSERIESYFTLFELLLAPKSNPLLAVEKNYTLPSKALWHLENFTPILLKEPSGMQSFWVWTVNGPGTKLSIWWIRRQNNSQWNF